MIGAGEPRSLAEVPAPRPVALVSQEEVATEGRLVVDPVHGADGEVVRPGGQRWSDGGGETVRVADLDPCADRQTSIEELATAGELGEVRVGAIKARADVAWMAV